MWRVKIGGEHLYVVSHREFLYHLDRLFSNFARHVAVRADFADIFAEEIRYISRVYQLIAKLKPKVIFDPYLYSRIDESDFILQPPEVLYYLTRIQQEFPRTDVHLYRRPRSIREKRLPRYAVQLNKNVLIERYIPLLRSRRLLLVVPSLRKLKPFVPQVKTVLTTNLHGDSVLAWVPENSLE